MTFNTGNNVPSTDPRDLYDNAENLDKLVNGVDPFYADRKGVLRESWAGMENTFDTSQEGRENAFTLSQADKESRFQAFLVSSGYVSKGDYAAGVVLAERNEYVAADAATTGTSPGLYRPNASATLPLTLTGTWATDSANLVLLGDDVLRQELAAADGVKLVGGALRKMADVAALRAEQGARDGEQVWLEAYGAGFANGGGGGPMFWDATSVAADDGWRVFAVSGVTTGRWVRPVSGELDAAWFGLPRDSGNCYAEMQKIEAYCYANRVGCYFGPGVYELGDNKFPFRNPEVPAASLRDYGGIVLRTAGPQTVIKTTSAVGNDVLQVNATKGLSIVGYPTITATLTGFDNAGSNGLSITYGGEDLYFELNCADLPFVDKGTYGDGGKAFTLQPAAENTNPIRNIVMKGMAKNCLYATGVDASYDSLSANPISGVVFDVVAEDCYRAISLGVSAPTAAPTIAPMMGVSAKIKAKNCQQIISGSRAPGLTADLEVLNTKTKAELGGYLASSTEVYVADIRAIKHSSLRIHGRVRDVDSLLVTGGTSMGGFVSTACEGMSLSFDVSFTAATDQLSIIDSGGGRVASSEVSLYGIDDVSLTDLVLYGGNSVKLNGRNVAAMVRPGAVGIVTPPAEFFAAVYADPLDFAKTVTLNDSAKLGDRVKVSRLASSTGESLTVGGLRSITGGQWIECTYSGSAWEVTSSGSI